MIKGFIKTSKNTEYVSKDGIFGEITKKTIKA
jgi:hypothetical protein